MIEYNKFRANVIKLRSAKHFKVTNSNGTKEAWRWIKKNKWLNIGQPLTEREFGAIVKAINRLYVKRLLEGHDIMLPCRMGKIELRKYKARIKYEDGKVVTNLPIDWKRTLQLWNEDDESRSNKTLIRRETKEVFRIIYNRQSANYNNKTFYQFSASRAVRQALSEKIKNNEIDTFLMGEYELH